MFDHNPITSAPLAIVLGKHFPTEIPQSGRLSVDATHCYEDKSPKSGAFSHILAIFLGYKGGVI
jgi:hypothetical protein